MNTLVKNGFVIVSYPPDLRRAVDNAVKSWKQFCALPDAVKKSLPYSNNSDGVGYELKQGSGNKADRKENFDVALGGKRWLDARATESGNAPAVRFVEAASVLAGIMKPLIVDFAAGLERDFGIAGLADEVSGSDDAYFIRFIHYFGERKVGEEIASAHVDQSAISLHLHESAPGFQVLMPFTSIAPVAPVMSESGHQWMDTPISAAQTVVIPSMQMQLRSEGKLTATCHRVIATGQTAETGRYSAVCFVQLKNTPKYDKDRNGRLQEKEPGFNYGMPFAEFTGLFKK